jgi:hypothetical protein
MVRAFRYFTLILKRTIKIGIKPVWPVWIKLMKHFAQQYNFWRWWWITGKKECADRLETG